MIDAGLTRLILIIKRRSQWRSNFRIRPSRQRTLISLSLSRCVSMNNSRCNLQDSMETSIKPIRALIPPQPSTTKVLKHICPINSTTRFRQRSPTSTIYSPMVNCSTQSSNSNNTSIFRRLKRSPPSSNFKKLRANDISSTCTSSETR